jgi:hypothetical protein
MHCEDTRSKKQHFHENGLFQAEKLEDQDDQQKLSDERKEALKIRDGAPLARRVRVRNWPCGWNRRSRRSKCARSQELKPRPSGQFDIFEFPLFTISAAKI